MNKKNAAPQQPLPPRRYASTFTHVCQRCGQSETLHGVSRYTEADYLELFHERMELDRRLRQALAAASYWHIAYQIATKAQNRPEANVEGPA